jgi:hypothetical protein
MCTTGRQIPASASTNQGPEQGRFDPTVRAGHKLEFQTKRFALQGFRGTDEILLRRQRAQIPEAALFAKTQVVITVMNGTIRS